MTLTSLSQEQIERKVERSMNSLDARLMAGKLSQAEYDREVSILDKWAQQQYDARRIGGGGSNE